MHGTERSAKKAMIVVNIFGGPGAGKSTTAAGAFHALKLMGHNVELVTEFAKDLTWEGRHLTLANQAYVFGEQLQRMHRLEGKVSAVITDSPLLISQFYMPKDYPDSFAPFVRDMALRYTNLNFLLRRTKAYVQAGRNQTYEEALAIDDQITDMLDEIGLPYSIMAGDEEAAKRIAARADELIRTDQSK